MSQPANDEANQALQAARALREAGEFAKALERHEWYHANALRINPGQYGVRLSFALGYWMDLANQYPPALASLKRLRDEGTGTIEEGKGTREIFDDVKAINGRLSENAATVALIRQLDTTQPELAKQCFRAIGATLIDENELEFFAKYVGDLKAYLAREIDTFNELAAGIRRGAHRMPAHDRKIASRIAERDIERFKSKLIGLTLTLAKLATDKGDPALAAELKAMTAKSVPDPRLEK